jgi:hypothetical protein
MALHFLKAQERSRSSDNSLSVSFDSEKVNVLSFNKSKPKKKSFRKLSSCVNNSVLNSFMANMSGELTKSPSSKKITKEESLPTESSLPKHSKISDDQLMEICA